MPRAGRKRSDKRRDRSGRVLPATSWEVLAPVLEAKCRRFGLKPTLANMRMVRAQEYGTPWGLMKEQGKISQREYDAAEKYTRAHWLYLLAIDAPFLFPKAANLDGIIKSSVDAGWRSEDMCRRAVNEWRSIDSALKSAGNFVRAETNAVCLEWKSGQADMVKIGLSALADHFRIKE